MMFEPKKLSKKYYFSVEGETESWYLEWLKKEINSAEASKYNVVFDCRIQKNPVKHVKSLVITEKTMIYHLSDYESNENTHTIQFQETMDNMKKAEKLGKQIEYFFGYSNFTFDLWMILHKNDCNKSFTHRSHYLQSINKAFGEKFENMDKYKKENNFKRLLSKLTLSDVKCAISRGESIMQNNNKNNYISHQYKGYTYYEENPSLLIWVIIKKILSECKLI